MQGNDVAGKVTVMVPRLLTVPTDFSTSVPAGIGKSGSRFFDVTYTAPDQVPSLLAHAMTSDVPGVGKPALTNPVPVGCLKLAMLHPPLVGHGWIALFGCCSVAGYHRTSISPINGVLQIGEQFAIDFQKAGPNNAC